MIATNYFKNKPPVGAIIDYGHSLSKGLNACWLMNEGAGNTIKDLINPASNGKFTNFAGNSGWNNNGKFGECVRIQNSTNFISCGTRDVVKLSSPMTISTWVYPNSKGGGGLARIFFKQGTSSSLGFHFQFESDGVANTFSLSIDGTATTASETNGCIVFGVWQHLLGTWDGGTAGNGIRLYYNGLESTYVGRFDGSGQGNFSGGLNHIGNRGDLGRGVDGSIDNVMIWNRVLSAQEIYSLYVNPYSMFYSNYLTQFRNLGIFRKTLSSIGTRTGTRQSQEWN